MTAEEIAFAAGKTPRLIKEHDTIIKEYREKGYVMETILNLEVNLETRLEMAIKKLIDGQMPV